MMRRMSDCLLIGNNEMEFKSYESGVRTMGINSGAYRDLNLNFIQYNRQLYSAPDAFNLFATGPIMDSLGKFSLDNTFNAAIAYLGTYLHRRGLTFDYVNSFQPRREELAEKLRDGRILTIAILTTLYVSIFPILEIISFIKKYNNSAKILIGGPFIGTQVKTQDELSLQYLFKNIGADVYINSSQGEATLVELIQAFKNNTPLDGIPNIHYRDGDKYPATPVVIENNILEENMVDWNLFADGIGKIAAVRTAISCPFSCSFCGFPQHAGKYQTASVAAVEKELDTLAAIGKVSCINFIDDTLNVPPERFKEILRMMIRNQYRFRWNCNFRCQFADREMIELMKESGCEGVFLGIESGSQPILNNMNKNASVAQYRSGHALLKEHGIITYMSSIIGFPGETIETARETTRFIEETGPTFFRTQLWYCDPFTPIWKEADRYQIRNSQFEWSHAAMDSQTACDLIDENFRSIQNSIWIPQYNFEFLAIFNLLHRGMSLAQIKEFITGFNTGVREKLRNPEQKEISAGAVEQMQNAFENGQSSPSTGLNNQLIDKYKAEFDF